MPENNDFELSFGTVNCDILRNGTDVEILSYINQIRTNLSSEEIISLYVKLLSVVTEQKALAQIIKDVDKIRDKVFLDALLDILLLKEKVKYNITKKEDYVNVRCLATKAIANLKDTKAVLPLLYCLNNKDEHYKLRLDCAEALGKIGDKYAVTPLIDVVSDENEKSVYIRESAAHALGMLGDVRAVDSLVNILENKHGLVNKFTFLKERIMEALGNITSKNDKIFKAMKDSLLDDSPQVRISAIEWLMNSEDERAVALIRQMIKDENEEVVKNAVIALYNLEGEQPLKELLESDDSSYVIKNAVTEVFDEVYSDEEDKN